MGHSHQIVALCLVFASILAIANFTVLPVFSQAYVTETSVLTKIIVGYTTSTSYLTAITLQITSSSSILTYVTMAYTTSTSYLTYMDLTATSSTSTYTYPVPGFNTIFSFTSTLDYVMVLFYAFLMMWSAMRAKTYYAELLQTLRRIPLHK